jgi:hypothetical protein
MLQYPNQDKVLSKNTEMQEMANNVGKRIRFTIYDRKHFPVQEKNGKIVGVCYSDYIVLCGLKKYIVSKNDYISIS